MQQPAPLLKRTWLRVLLACVSRLFLHCQSVEIVSVYPSKGSTYGGTYLVITGSGFLMPSEGNPWDSQVVYVGAQECSILAHFTNATQIVCLTPPSPNGPFGHLDSYLPVGVQVFSGLGAASYASFDNAFQYDSFGEFPQLSYVAGNTPSIHYAREWAATAGDVIKFGGYIRTDSDGTADKFEVRINNVKCHTDEEVWPISTSRRRWQSLKYVDCQLPDDALLQPGKHNITMRWHQIDPTSESCTSGACFPLNDDEMSGLPDSAIGGYGYGGVVMPTFRGVGGHLGRAYGGVVDLASLTPYHFEVYPQVNWTVPAAGGVHGGNKLTVHGTSFSEHAEDNSVTVGGVPCSVVSASTTKLVCVLGAGGNSTPEGDGTPRGLVYEDHTGVWFQLPNAVAAVDGFEDLLTYVGTGLLKAKLDNSWERSDIGSWTIRETAGYFVPPLTAKYTFLISGENSLALDIGTNSSLSSLRRVASMEFTSAAFDEVHEFVSPNVFFTNGNPDATIDSRNFTGPDKQISHTIEFVAGERYAFRIRHTNKDWAGSSRLGMIVSGLSSATTAAGEMFSEEAIRIGREFSPAMELQLLRLRLVNVRRETHSIYVGNVGGGAYRLRLLQGAQELLLALDASYSADELTGAFRASGRFAYCQPFVWGVTATLITDNAETGERLFHLEFACPVPEGSDEHVVIEIYDGGNAEPTVGNVQDASAPLGGTFRVGYDGVWGDSVYARADWSYGEYQLIRGIGQTLRRRGEVGLDDVEVEYWIPGTAQPNVGEGFDAMVRFRRPIGNVGELQVDSSLMTGDFEFSVITLMDGDDDAVQLERISLAYFEVPYPDEDPAASIVRVVSNGMLATSLGLDISMYTYSDELTPILHSVTPSSVQAGSLLTLEVENLEETPEGELNVTKVSVALGEGAICNQLADVTDGMGSRRTLQCVIQPGGRAGEYPVKLLSASRGLADPATAPTVVYRVTIDSISPLSGSAFGGTLITLLGDGLGGLSCTSLLIGGNPCSDLASAGLPVLANSTEDSLVCVTPFPEGLDLAAGSAAADIVLDQPPTEASTSRGTFTYGTSFTPHVGSISPSFQSAALSTEITLAGTGFGGADTPTVLFGTRQCKVSSYSDTSITCFLPRAAPTPPEVTTVKPTLWVPSAGFPDPSPLPSLTSKFEVNAIEPAMGSQAGGAVLNITGSGFHATATKHVITLDLADGTTRSCSIISGTTTHLTCRVEGGHTAVASDSGAERRLQALKAAGVPGAENSTRCARGSRGHCFAHAVLDSGVLRSGVGAASHHTVRGLSDLAGASGHHLGPMHKANLARRLAGARNARSLTAIEDGSSIVGISLNGVEAALLPDSVGSFSFSADVTRTVLGVSPRNGSYADGTVVSVLMQGQVDHTRLTVLFGEHECSISSASFDSTAQTTTLQVPLCSFPASDVPVYVLEEPYGYATGASPYTGASFQFQQLLQVFTVSPATGSYYGGTELTISGAAFFPVTTTRNFVLVGEFPCSVVSSSLDEVKCITQQIPTEYAEADYAGQPMVVTVWLLSEGGLVNEEDQGLQAKYYASDPYSSESVAPLYERIEPQVAHEATQEAWDGLPDVVPLDRYWTHWSGYIIIREGGIYKFTTTVDDGVRLYIDGGLHINAWNNQNGVPYTGRPLYLAQGAHLLVLHHYEATGNQACMLSYNGPDTEGDMITVPATAFTHVKEGDGSSSQAIFAYGNTTTAPSLESMEEIESGVKLLLSGTGFGSTAGLVALGTASIPSANFLCDVTSWSDGAVECLLPQLPAGSWQIRLATAEGWSGALSTLYKVPLVVEEVQSVDATVQQDSSKDPWRLVLKMSGDKNGEFGYDSEYWTNTATYNDQSPADDVDDAKYEAFSTVPFRKMLICFGSARGSCFEHTLGSLVPNALALFSSGNYSADNGINRSAFMDAFDAPSFSTCPGSGSGFNVECTSLDRRARFGLCLPCATEKNCGSQTWPIGIGIRDFGTQVPAGHSNRFSICGGNVRVYKALWLWVLDPEAEAVPSLPAGLGGGMELYLRGKGFGLLPEQTQVRVCGEECEVVSTNTSEIMCRTPARRTNELVNAYPDYFGADELQTAATRFFSDLGDADGDATIAKNTFSSSIDEAISMYYNGDWRTRNPCWFAFELPVTRRALVTSVDFYPSTNPVLRAQLADTVFEVRNLTGESDWVEVASLSASIITGSTLAQGWNTFPLDTPISAQAFRIRPLPNGCPVGELYRSARFNGVLLDFDDSGVCAIEVPTVEHPLASTKSERVWVSAQLEHSLARTPILTALSPNRGSARGDTVVELNGTGLNPLDSQGNLVEDPSRMKVLLNGYDCTSVSVGASGTTCMTVERLNGITAPSTSVWFEGRGYALTVGGYDATTFKYIDKWSDVHSWLDSEPPVDGDSVVVPEGQAIMLDEDSPKLFLLLIMGYMEFDRKDLALNATYIWLAGGQLQVGTEETPFLQKATITLHGDRYSTIELPFIGSKMIAVTNLGGLHGGCYQHTVRLSSEDPNYIAKPDYCKVRSVAKLDLHGKPGLSWTRLTQTASINDTTLHLAEPANWEVGDSIVITPSEMEEEEVRHVKSVSDDGLVVEVDEPLERTHLGEWFHHESTEMPTDLRAAVGLLTRNVIIQGDDDSARPGNAYMFGGHVGVFMGGEMRIENTEFFRTGQAALLGRYSSHYHLLSPGRDIDVVDKAYLRNNSYRNTFQRAVVIHGTDYAIVKHNVAYKVKGHMYFTETGAEHFSLFEHNLAVHTIPHHLLLDDDDEPAGFWLPGFTGWHRSNLAAYCTRGWRLRILNGPAPLQRDLTFFNNSAHACAWGWHLKPPHGGPTLQTFRTFTMFRCNTGMFYYNTWNIQHEDHRFVECAQAHDQIHSNDHIHSAPFYTNGVMIGNIDNEATQAKGWRGMRTPRDNEFFYISGLKVINYWQTPVLYGCYFEVCTIRVERTEWYNSNWRTLNTWMAGIFWDLDGTLTGYPNGFVSTYRAYNDFPGLCGVQPEHPEGIVCGKADGSLRMRRLLVAGQAPWQLDFKNANITSSAGEEQSPFDQRSWGWPTPVVDGQVYDFKVDDPNDFTTLTFTYGLWDLIMQEHGWEHTRAQPKSEGIVLHLNYSTWRDHFDASRGEAVHREPAIGDDYGTYSMRLWESYCEPYFLTAAMQEKCSGNYLNQTGRAFRDQIIAQPGFPEIQGRVTVALYTKVTQADDGTWLPSGGTPRNDSAMNFSLTAMECEASGCPTPAPVDEGDLTWRLWSDPSGWPGGVLPEEGANVELAVNDAVILDVDTPVLYWLSVGGRLKAARDVSSSINAHSIMVWGVLDLGTEEDPIPPSVTCTVSLSGVWSDLTVIMTEGLFLLNKVLAVHGTFTAVGTATASRTWVKLSATAEIGSASLVVRGDMSTWPVGGSVAIAATEYPQPPETTETEVRAIQHEPVYDAATDTTTIELDQPLLYRHFAGDIAPGEDGHWTAYKLAGVVGLESGWSNVIIKTSETDSDHGGTVVIAGSQDGLWTGSCTLKSVQFERMGKADYQHPSLLFKYLGESIGKSPGSSVEGCVFGHSQSGAIELDGMSSVEITNNVIHDTYRTALWVKDTSLSDSVSITGNAAIQTLRHPKETLSWVRPFASFLLETTLANFAGNVAAGSTDAGFYYTPAGSDCPDGAVSAGEGLQEEELNEAFGCMTGFWVLNPPDGGKCVTLRGAVAWKNSHVGIMTIDQSRSLRLDTVLVADNHIGIVSNFVRPQGDILHRIFSYNISVFGSTAASTCEASLECRAFGRADTVGAGCNSVLGTSYRHVGIVAHMTLITGKTCLVRSESCRPSTTPIKLCVMPWEHRLSTMGSAYSEAHWSAVTFGSFTMDDCGMKSVGFMTNPTALDVPYPNHFSDVKWLSTVSASGRFHLDKADVGSQNRVDCGSTCDVIAHTTLVDVDGTLLETGVPQGTAVTQANPALATAACDSKTGYFACGDLKLRYLLWQGFGGPPEREQGRIKAWRASDDRATWSEGGTTDACVPKDPTSDRGVMLRSNDYYNLTLFGSPPPNHRLFYLNDDEDGIRLDLFLNQPFRIEVYVDGQLLDENEYDTTLRATPSPTPSDAPPAPDLAPLVGSSGIPLPTLNDAHGTYAFDPHERRFYLTMKGGTYNGKKASKGGGFIVLRMMEVVQLSMSLNTDSSSFDSGSFVSNLATLLGIHPSRIKVVSVQSKAQVNGGRRMTGSTSSELLVQIVEENPEPVPDSAFDADVTDDTTTTTMTSTTGTTTSQTATSTTMTVTATTMTVSVTTRTTTATTDTRSTSSTTRTSISTTGTTITSTTTVDPLAALQMLAEEVQKAATNGTLSDQLGFNASVDEVEVTEPAAPAATETSTTTETTTTTATRTTVSSISSVTTTTTGTTTRTSGTTTGTSITVTTTNTTSTSSTTMTTRTTTGTSSTVTTTKTTSTSSTTMTTGTTTGTSSTVTTTYATTTASTTRTTGTTTGTSSTVTTTKTTTTASTTRTTGTTTGTSSTVTTTKTTTTASTTRTTGTTTGTSSTVTTTETTTTASTTRTTGTTTGTSITVTTTYATSTSSTTGAKDKVQVSLTVQNVDYTALTSDATLLASFEDATKEEVANAAGDPFTKDDVELEISEGSVNVVATMIVPEGTTAASAQAALAANEEQLTSGVVSSVTSIANIASATVGTISVADLAVDVVIGATTTVEEEEESTSDIPAWLFVVIAGAGLLLAAALAMAYIGYRRTLSPRDCEGEKYLEATSGSREVEPPPRIDAFGNWVADEGEGWVGVAGEGPKAPLAKPPDGSHERPQGWMHSPTSGQRREEKSETKSSSGSSSIATALPSGSGRFDAGCGSTAIDLSSVVRSWDTSGPALSLSSPKNSPSKVSTENCKTLSS